MNQDTIAAVASGMTASGIGIIRISGPEAFSVLKRVFRPKKPGDVLTYRTHTIHYGFIVNPIDTYTGSNIHSVLLQPTEKENTSACDGRSKDIESISAEDSVSEDNVSEEETISAEDRPNLPQEQDKGCLNHNILDECLVMVMRGPATYTTEDTVEINCHGGPYVMRRVLDTVLQSGARLAEPGEFTKRAFLGGRIDLSEAEAVMDVISAGSEDALRSSENQLSGSIRREITSLRETILDELSYIEAALDDPEHYEMDGYGEELLAHLAPVKEKLLRLRKTYEEGRFIRDGILTVILGKPNAGKSSLLNALTGEDRAIVTDIEGTTRDVLEEQVRVGGIMLRILDTAGIRDARDRIEQIGIEKALASAESADLILAVFDASREIDDNDRQILAMLKDRRSIILLNKMDIGSEVLTKETLTDLSGGQSVIEISALEKTGLNILEAGIRDLFFKNGVTWNEEAQLTNSRHKEAVDRALDAMRLLETSVRDGMTEDFFAEDLMAAYANLGEIIGEQVGDDLVDNIFSKFCMGK